MKLPLLLALWSMVLVRPALAALPVPDPDNGGLELRAGFRALIVADKLIDGRKVGKDADQLRFLAVAPNGDLYAKTARGGIIALRDNDGDGRFEEKHEFGSGGGTGIALRGDWLYSSTNDAVYRYKLTPGELVPARPPETVIRGLPDGHQHEAKSFAFGGDGQLYVEVGSPSNAYGNPDRAYMKPGTPSLDPTTFLQTHGGFWRFDPDRLNQTQADGFHFSTGHRHVLSIAWNRAAQVFFVVQMGRDQLNVVAPEYYDELDNAERVAEVMHSLPEGTNLGWPYTYWDPIKKARMLAPEHGGDGRKRAEPGKYPDPVLAFPAHWAPLQMSFYYASQFPPKYRNGAFVTFHGSWNRAPLPQAGFRVAFVPFDEKGAPRGDYEAFALDRRGAQFRMGGVAVGPDGSLYISETDIGRIWRIIYTGENAPMAVINDPVSGNKASATTGLIDSPGKIIYEQICAACHMRDGSGAGQMQPALAGSAVVKGDPGQIIRVALNGPAAALPADRPKYSNVMPSLSSLTNEQIADVLTYVRRNFGGGASPVTSAQVAAQR
jgi:glucose/arabinose dehydrogenase/mono/diheme cytochrome c family protein